jgi:hypothetical protein
MVYGLLLATILIASLSIIAGWSAAGKAFKYGWHQLLAAFSVGLFIYLYGTWVYLSINAKYVFGVIFLLAIIFGLLRKPGTPRAKRGSRLVINLLLILIFGTMSILYFTGTTGKPEKAALSFPLRTGKYFILQGGKGLPSNFFHYSYRGAVYAIDIARLNKFGNRANHIFSSKLEDYEIYGDTVFSPCDGRVLQIANENPDNIPPSRKRGPSNTNNVLIETDSFYVFMAHFQQNSVIAKEGDLVRTGDPLALVGNSGFSLEPHLHIQVHANSHTGLPWYEERQLYIQFDGRTYLLFEVIRPNKVRMVRK